MTHFLSAAIYFFVILGIMVLIHEFGHFLAARLCGVRVEAFALGFGKRLFGYKSPKSGTDYRVNLLPFGGYVKMTGELDAAGVVDVEQEDTFQAAPDPESFHSKTRWQRAIIAVAGPVANFILSIVVLTFVAMYHHEVAEGMEGPAVVDYVPANTPAAQSGMQSGDTVARFDTIENPTWDDIARRAVVNINHTVAFSYLHNGKRTDSQILVKSDPDPSKLDPSVIGFIPVMQKSAVSVMAVENDTPASRAGLQAGDTILSIDGLHLHSVVALLAYMQDAHGKQSTLRVQRDSAQVTLPITPEVGDIGTGKPQYRLGFRPAPTVMHVERLPFTAAVAESLHTNRDNILLLRDVIAGMFTHHVSVKTLSGPIGIAQQVSTAASYGIWPLLEITASISLQLGLLNLLPFPLLDGGMILFLAIEGIIRRDLNMRVKEMIYQCAFFLIVGFAAFVLYNDIMKLHIGH